MNTEKVTYIERAKRIVEHCDYVPPETPLHKIPHSALYTASKLRKLAVDLRRVFEICNPAMTNPSLWPTLYPKMIAEIGELVSSLEPGTLLDANHELLGLARDHHRTREIMRVAEELELADRPQKG